MKNTFYIILLLFIIPEICKAQLDNPVLTYTDYLSHVLRFHPMAEQADIIESSAALEVLAARGVVDPKLAATWNQKNFDEKLYYRQFQTKLTVPTRLGVDVVAGYENTDGVFLNPENKTDQHGLWNIGLEADIFGGLIGQERKLILQQAELMKDMGVQQRLLMINDLIYVATGAYLDWQQFELLDSIIAQNIILAENYFSNTKISFFNGEKTAIDTLEAYLIRQDRLAIRQDNQANLVAARRQLENYLWWEERSVELQPATRPQSVFVPLFNVDSLTTPPPALLTHPMLLEKQVKLEILASERRLKRQKLRPKLKAKFNPLVSTSENSITPTYNSNDYKWGFDLSLPLFFRSERAALEQADLKIRDLNLEVENKRNELENKQLATLEKLAILNDQIILQTQNVEGYRQLLEGENEKFRFGESSVFLVNKRQEKYLDGQIKLLQLQFKIQFEQLNYLYFINRLPN